MSGPNHLKLEISKSKTEHHKKNSLTNSASIDKFSTMVSKIKQENKN